MVAEWLHLKGALVLVITFFFQMLTMWEISALPEKDPKNMVWMDSSVELLIFGGR